MKKRSYHKEIVNLYMEFMKFKIFDSSRCRLCKTCIHSTRYIEDTEIFSNLEKKSGFFYKCKNTIVKAEIPDRFYCFYYKKKTP